MPLRLHLKAPENTIELGQLLAEFFANAEKLPALLLQGDLGSGKTTLVRGLVESLPGSEMAEVSSPSFNIFNLYPTVPSVAHFDLYRLEGMPPDDALFENLENPEVLTVVEWIQYLERDHWPDEAILLEWSPSETGRTLEMHAMGKAAQEFIKNLTPRLKHLL